MRFVSTSCSRPHNKISSDYFVSGPRSFCIVIHPIQVATAKRVYLVLNAKLPVLKHKTKRNLSALLLKQDTNPSPATCFILILSKFQSFLAAHVL